MRRPDPREFGRRPHVPAAELHRKRIARLATVGLMCGGMLGLLLAYVLTGVVSDTGNSTGPNVAGFVAFVLTIGGFGAFALAVLAAREC